MKKNNEVFKECTMCNYSWINRDNFLSDPMIEIFGYQAILDDLLTGLFLFSHHSCKTTLAIPVKNFTDLYDGPIYEEHLAGNEECPEYCLQKNELSPCPEKCECAYIREILQIVKGWAKIESKEKIDKQ